MNSGIGLNGVSYALAGSSDAGVSAIGGGISMAVEFDEGETSI